MCIVQSIRRIFYRRNAAIWHKIVDCVKKRIDDYNKIANGNVYFAMPRCTQLTNNNGLRNPVYSKIIIPIVNHQETDFTRKKHAPLEKALWVDTWSFITEYISQTYFGVIFLKRWTITKSVIWSRVHQTLTKLAVSAYACIRQNWKLFHTSSYGQKRAYFLENALCRIDWSFWLQSYCAMLDYLNIIWVFKKWWTLPAIETKSAWHSYWLSKMACGFRFVIHKNFEAIKLHSINVFKTVLKGPKNRLHVLCALY